MAPRGRTSSAFYTRITRTSTILYEQEILSVFYVWCLIRLRSVLEDRIVSRRANVVWPPRSYDLTLLDYYLWGAVKDKCCTDKPQTIGALKDNIREAIGEIQLHTIDNAEAAIWMKLFSFINRKDCTFK